MSIPDLPTVPDVSSQSKSGLTYHILGTVQQTLAVDLNPGQTIFSYTVGKTPVLESAGLEATDDLKALSRTFHVEASEVPMEILLATAATLVASGAAA